MGREVFCAIAYEIVHNCLSVVESAKSCSFDDVTKNKNFVSRPDRLNESETEFVVIPLDPSGLVTVDQDKALLRQRQQGQLMALPLIFDLLVLARCERKRRRERGFQRQLIVSRVNENIDVEVDLDFNAEQIEFR